MGKPVTTSDICVTLKNFFFLKQVPLTHQPLIGNMAGEMDYLDEIEETDRPRFRRGCLLNVLVQN